MIRHVCLDIEEAERAVKFGLDLDEHGKFSPSGLDAEALDRGDTLDSREVAIALAFFDDGPCEVLDRVKQNSPNATQLKHAIARWAHAHCFGEYIAPGAVLLAARWRQVPLRRITGTHDAQVGVKLLTDSGVRRHPLPLLGWLPVSRSSTAPAV